MQVITDYIAAACVITVMGGLIGCFDGMKSPLQYGNAITNWAILTVLCITFLDIIT